MPGMTEYDARQVIAEVLRRGQPSSGYIPHEPTGTQQAFLDFGGLEALYGGAAGGGKILERGGVVLTPFGFKKCEDLRVGDRVNAADGTTCRIIQLHPWRKLERWEVCFHDGTSTVVNGDHLWLAWRSGKRKKRPRGGSSFGKSAAEIIETRELLQWLESAKSQHARGIRPNWPAIPVCAPQPFNVTARYRSSLDAYQLGVWLGDGHHSKSSIGITSVDHSHMRLLLEGEDYAVDRSKTYRFRGETGNRWKSELKDLDLAGKKSHTKFVPRQYLLGSIECRLSVLQGLMDTDGTADDRGQAYYTTTSKRLAIDVAFLVQSLGGTATTFGKEPFYRNEAGEKVYCKHAYTLYIKLGDGVDPFRMRRKLDRYKPSKNMYRRVADIKVGGTMEGRCITVSHPSGLYITNDFIVTHNSDAMLMGALEHIDKPNYAALLLRRTFKDLSLPGALLDRARDWLAGADVHWSDKEKKFTFPSGAKLVFGYLESEADKYQYQSSEFQYIGFDESTQFSETQYTYLLSRLRRLVGMEAIPLKARCASNPGGVGHEWVKRRFVDAKTRGVRAFFPALLDDNPFIDQAAYEVSLNELDPITYDQLRKGLWVRDAFGLVYKFNWDLNAAEDLPDDVDRKDWIFIHGIDLGSSERKPTTAYCVQAFHPDILAVYTVFSEKHQALTPTDIADRWKQINAAWPAESVVVDTGGLGKGYLGEFQMRHGMSAEPAEKHNKLGYRKLASGDLAKGKAVIVAGDNPELIEEFDNLPWNEKGDDNEKGKDNHLSDAWLYSWRKARHWLSDEPVDGPKKGSDEYFAAQAAAMRERHREKVEQSKMSFQQRRRMKRWGTKNRIIRPR